MCVLLCKVDARFGSVAARGISGSRTRHVRGYRLRGYLQSGAASQEEDREQQAVQKSDLL